MCYFVIVYSKKKNKVFKSLGGIQQFINLFSTWYLVTPFLLRVTKL